MKLPFESEIKIRADNVYRQAMDVLDTTARLPLRDVITIVVAASLAGDALAALGTYTAYKLLYQVPIVQADTSQSTNTSNINTQDSFTFSPFNKVALYCGNDNTDSAFAKCMGGSLMRTESDPDLGYDTAINRFTSLTIDAALKIGVTREAIQKSLDGVIVTFDKNATNNSYTVESRTITLVNNDGVSLDRTPAPHETAHPICGFFLNKNGQGHLVTEACAQEIAIVADPKTAGNAYAPEVKSFDELETALQTQGKLESKVGLVAAFSQINQWWIKIDPENQKIWIPKSFWVNKLGSIYGIKTPELEKLLGKYFPEK